ncbi:MAG: ABC transporter ATP-binding protein/permease [Clostridia bacterium]|nr:ABC transporter ATP-binding protein/permease [Clostridia bacterium]
MLQLKDIKKDYLSGDNTVHALKGVSLDFRKNEFVSILGQSGCGKTTLLNIIGGLDKYTSGDLIINGKSTKDFRDADWDTYRNHSIGFVFQSYNLIPHQTVLANVELALTLSGVSADERKARAIAVLEKVGLGDQIHKKPNQMSGGQMQRVAIARALVNDPDILLADEPTGALDSETSVQIMDILKEISKEKLIIMVTHNPDLAEEYSSRIIRLLDGEVVSDTNPYSAESTTEEVLKFDTSIIESTESSRPKKKKKKSMSFFTALKLSLTNLMTKKGRTFLTAFAGSIGIIGIALILSVSNGVNSYIQSIEESTMASYPLRISETTTDTTTLLGSFMGGSGDVENQDPNKIYTNDAMINVLESFTSGTTTNNLSAFKKYIETSKIPELSIDVKYNYSTKLNAYYVNKDGTSVSTNKTLEGIGDILTVLGMSGFESFNTIGAPWTEIIGSDEYINSQYDCVYGHLPENENQVILFVDQNNQIPDYVLYELGIKDITEVIEYLQNVQMALANGTTYEGKIPQSSYTFEDICGYKFKVLPNSDYYEYVSITDANGNILHEAIVDRSEDIAYINEQLKDARELEIVGIYSPKEGSSANTTGVIGYTNELITAIINDEINSSDVVKAQLANKKTDLFTGFPFKLYTVEDAPMLREMLLANPSFEGYHGMITTADPESLVNFVNKNFSTTYEANLDKLGYVDFDKPSAILIYPNDFEAKDEIASIIADYNKKATDEGRETDVINYSDMAATLMSSVQTIINAISYVLIAFVAISLIVSSIMIGIITYISVLERTKEIGILRSIGASKKDVSRVFNAETLIVGFVAGAIGIIITLILNVIITAIIRSLTGIVTLSASLPFLAAVILILISMGLTLIAGLVPSRIAAKKDPVIALRTE